MEIHSAIVAEKKKKIDFHENCFKQKEIDQSNTREFTAHSGNILASSFFRKKLIFNRKTSNFTDINKRNFWVQTGRGFAESSWLDEVQCPPCGHKIALSFLYTVR